MNRTIHHKLPCAASSQRGAVLIVSLIFLLLMTIIGVTTMQTTTLQERMAGNTRDMNIALQASETALRDAEAWLGLAGNSTQADTHAELTNPVAWDGATPPPLAITMTSLGHTASPGLVYVAAPTQVFYGGSQSADFAGTTSGMGPPANFYPITSLASGGSDSTVVMLHSMFKIISD